MGEHAIMVDDIVLPPQVTFSKPLTLLAHGVTEIEIHFLQIKHNAIGIYSEPSQVIISHLQQWKGKSGKELLENDEFFDHLIAAPVEMAIRVVVIKEIKASQYGSQLECAVRERLAAVDKYEEEEETALEKVADFFPVKYLKKNSFFTFYFPAASAPFAVEIVITTDEKEETKMRVENANVAEMIKRWYLGGSRATSPSTIQSLADNLSAELAI